MEHCVGDNNEQEYQRPRRPNPETISYLRSLPLNVAESNQQVSQFLEKQQQQSSHHDDDDDDTVEFPQILFAAIMALMEVSNEMASLAADEQGSECVEVLAHICLPYSATCGRLILTAFQGYQVFLSTHRFGSHVLQTILQLVSATAIDHETENNSNNKKIATKQPSLVDLALHPEAPPLTLPLTSLAGLSDLILGVVEELLPFTSSLAVHVCGSHVLRTLLCVLGGVQLVHPNVSPTNSESGGLGIMRERRGKQKRKKKSTKAEDDSGLSSSNPTAVMIYLNKNTLGDSAGSLFQDALSQLTKALTEDAKQGRQHKESSSAAAAAAAAPGHLQQLVCHPSAGPLLVVLLRVLTYSDAKVKQEWHNKLTLAMEHQPSQQQRRLGLRRPEPTFLLESSAHQLVKRILCVVDDSELPLPATIDTDEDNDTTATCKKQQPHAPDVIYGMAGEPRGSHVLETIMCLCHDSVYTLQLEWGEFTNPTTLRDYLEHAVSNFCIVTLLSTVRTADQAATMLKALDKVVSNGYIVDPKKKRRAVLWRAVEMSSKFRVGQDSLLKAIRLGFISLEGTTSAATEESNAPEDATDQKAEPTNKKKRRKASAMQIQDCIRPLLGLLSGSEHRDDEADAISNKKIQLDVLGTRTVFHLLRFAPRLSLTVADGILQNIARHELELIAKDGLGSCCIMDGILELSLPSSSSSTGDAAGLTAVLQQLLTKLQGRWVELATDRVGHHSVIKLFQALERMEDKEDLVTELIKSRSKLKSTAMGRKVMEVCALQEYIDSKDVWRQTLAKRKKREEFLNEIVQDVIEKDDATVQKKRKRSKKGDNDDAHPVESSASAGHKKGRSETAKSSVESIMNAILTPKSRSAKK